MSPEAALDAAIRTGDIAALRRLAGDAWPNASDAHGTSYLLCAICLAGCLFSAVTLLGETMGQRGAEAPSAPAGQRGPLTGVLFDSLRSQAPIANGEVVLVGTALRTLPPWIRLWTR